MKKMKTFKILSSLSFAFFFLFIALPVKADDVKWCLESQPSDVDVSQRYGLSLTSIGGNQYKLKMAPPSNKKERCKMTFHVSQINMQDRTVEQHLSCDNELVLEINDTTSDTEYGLPGILVKLDSDDKIIKNENEKNSCYYAGGSVTLEISVPIGTGSTSEECPPAAAIPDISTTPAIDCNHSFPEGSFEYKFCYAKNNAEKTFDFSKTGGKFNGNYSDLTFKCEYNLDSGKIPMKQEELKGENYYVNKHYIYGKSSETISLGNYTYHYSPGKETKGSAISCEVTCEESVEVEYGPPVASKAGMCFEYKVRVTSRTSCNMSKAPTPPNTNCDYCTPSPQCKGRSGKVFLQGGPNEDFDACVRGCDGGKYTESCSNMCYDKIYGTTATNVSLLTDAKKTYTASLSDCLELNPIGCYTKDNAGNIEWTAGSSPSRGGEGRWYKEHEGGTFHNGSYVVDTRGFWRRKYNDGRICNDTCTWIGCEGDVYINPGMAQKDYEKNMALYAQAVQTCQAKAVCSTTTSEYTISADYTPEGGTEVNINFPYEIKKDTITHQSSTVIDTSSSKDSTLLPDEPNEGEGLLGCYNKNDKTSKNLYRSTWSFPGTWINGKTGEISFVAKSADNTSWKEHNNKFCIPLDAKRVNSDWWNWYYNKLTGLNNINLSVNSDSEVANSCKTATTKTIVDPGVVTENDITWNIHAKTNKFGYFEWLIQMDCFYALNPKPTTPTTNADTTEINTKCDPEPENYRVRTIDLENVFPANDGSQTTTAQQAGRTPGFNWSTYADNTKNENYTSNPEKYMEKIQTLGYGVYADENLDYEFTLSPSTIKSMRKSSSNANYSGTNYTNFDDSGFFIDSNGVSRYKSTKIRGIDGNSKIPNDKAILCNNMINYKSSNCDVAG